MRISFALTVAFCVCLLGGATRVASAETARKTATRILSFPQKTFGTIKIVGSKQPWLAAHGDVTVPSQAWIDLCVNFDSAGDLSPLKKLPPDALHKLTLSKLEVTDDQLKNITGLTGLVNLDLEETDITDQGLAVLAKLPRLRYLKLRSTLITANGLKHLSPLIEMQNLDISDCQIGDDGPKNLVPLKHLKDVTVSHTQLTDRGAKYLANLTELAVLNVGRNNITDATPASLTSLKSLRYLNIIDTKLTTNCLKSLQQMPALRVIIFSRNNFSPADATILSRGLPRCRVEDDMKHRNVQMDMFAPLH